MKLIAARERSKRPLSSGAALPPRGGRGIAALNHVLGSAIPILLVATAGMTQAAPAGSSAHEPFPYTYIGAVGDESGQRKVVLVRNSSIFLVGRGEVLERSYRIRAIDQSGVDVFFLGTQTRRLVPFSEIAQPGGWNDAVASGHPSETGDDAGNRAPDGRHVQDAVTLEDLMGLRPPSMEMETHAPRPRSDMVALPPSNKDLQGLPE